MVFALLDLLDEALGIEVGTASTTGGHGARSGKDHLLATVALKDDVGRMPLIGLAKWEFGALVTPFDALEDLLRHWLLPLPVVWRIHSPSPTPVHIDTPP